MKKILDIVAAILLLLVVSIVSIILYFASLLDITSLVIAIPFFWIFFLLFFKHRKTGVPNKKYFVLASLLFFAFLLCRYFDIPDLRDKVPESFPATLQSHPFYESYLGRTPSFLCSAYAWRMDGDENAARLMVAHFRLDEG